MTKIAQINDRSATTAWSPIAEYADVIALGIKDSGGTGFEETGGELDLYDMNLTRRGGGGGTNNNNGPTLLASVKTQSRFASLGWSTGGSLRSKYPMGILAGGMEDGTVHIWNPLATVQQQEQQQESSSTVVIGTYTQHQSGPVKAVQFSTLVPTQLATGGSDGKVFIYNLDQLDIPPFMPCSNGTHQKAQITAVAWNTQVAHILASASTDGTVSVWDIKSRKAWCELRGEAAGQAVSDIAWNPTEGLHLLTASADDRNPIIKLWDLRASTSMPLATLAGHSQGIISMAWCPHDDHLLLSCGKDNRTILWDLFAMTPIGDVPNDGVQSNQEVVGGHHMAAEPSMFGLASSQQRRYDVQWSPIKRGIVSTSSLDRKVQVHSILGLSSSSGRPPKWMRPSSSVSCGFGGSVVSCGVTDKIVRVRTVVEEPTLEKVSRDFESTMDPNNIIVFCAGRATSAKDATERRLWLFMQVIFEANARQHLLDTLGFDPAVIAAKASAYKEVEAVANGVHTMSLEDRNHTQMSPVTQDLVKKALMVGNFEAAVECCFRTGNLADALVLASCGGADLWTKTQDRYFESQSTKRPFLSVVSAIIRDDLETFVQTSDPAKWQETLAVLSTYGKSDQFPQLCVSLGDLLKAAGDDSSASLCYLCSLSLDKTVDFWRSQLVKKDGGMDLLTLHEFVVKVSVFLQAVGPSAQLSNVDSMFFSTYAEKLAEQGLLVTAAKYCVGESKESRILRDRLYRSRSSQYCLAAMGGVPPEFPYTAADVRQSRVVSRVAQPKANAANGGVMDAKSGTSQEQYGQQHYQQQQSPAPVVSNELPPGWIELQDPGSGRSYYAHQTTGEVTWDRPQAPQPAPVAAPDPVQAVQQSAAAPAATSRNTKLASKYGDGFVTSASHPELASQYGNVGTTNPYHVTARPGIAQVPGSTPSKAPVSGNLETIPELKEEYQPISDILLSLIEALKGGQLTPSDRRQISEAEKAVAIFAKRLARGDIAVEIADRMLSMTTYLSNYDWPSANSVQTALVSQEWRDHKDWLKGIKTLVQLATKMYSR